MVDTSTAISTQIMTSLGAGSGVDIVSLARNLTNAEQVPKTAAIQSAIDAAEAQVSAYGLISYQLGLLQSAFEGLNDAKEVTDSYASSTDTAMQFTAFDGTEVDGSYNITVNQLAQEKIMISDEYSSTSAVLSASSFDLSVTVGNTSTATTSITVDTMTPQGVVDAINEESMGVTASLVDTGIDGTNYRIILTGETGSESAFTVTSDPDLGFGDAGNTLQAAQDAQIDFDGLTLTRDSNEFSDVVSGATLTLYETTTSAVTVAVYSDTSTLKTKLEDVVALYNDYRGLMDELTATTIDEDVELSGALQRDLTTARYITDQIRTAILDDSSTASGNVSAFRDIGISIDSKGALTFDETTFDDVIQDSYDDVVTMLTANTNNQSLYSTDGMGLAQDIATIIDGIVDIDGVLATRETNAEATVIDYQDELTVLEARMSAVYDRYLSQFTAMELLTNKLNNVKDYLTGQLEVLSKAYDSD
ncbi:flagellar filament capping protein FliD [SAR92 clade bacterium H455]|uniref:Flagellar hook-associated protein 2 n=1 Tax=SAR92 clade bacterium H455 TaxID=2974818 RepID=A0ABY5TMW0_9GAMM|nr:flagellar filament capping protein FliD [SAR92 clade bacterium H455]